MNQNITERSSTENDVFCFVLFFFLLYANVKGKKKLIKQFASFGIESMHGR